MSKLKEEQSNKIQRTKCEVWSRAVGYLRPIEQWHSGKQAEFKDRKTFDKQVTTDKDKLTRY